MIKSRPFPVTVVCLYLLISGSYHLVKSFEYLNRPETRALMDQIEDQTGLPNQVQVAVLYINLVISVVSAMFMFQEKNWARWLYLAWSLVFLGYSLYFEPDWYAIIPTIATFPVFTLTLLLPSANRYFSLKEDYEFD